MSSSTFCPLPFAHINIKPNGRVSACWRHSNQIGDYTKKSLTEIWNDAPITELRSDLLNDKQPSDCKSCWDMERSGILSTRQRSINDYAHLIDEKTATSYSNQIVPITEVKSIEVRVGNACNLMCRHCSPEYSSIWENAVIKNEPLRKELRLLGVFDPKVLAGTEDLSRERIDEIKGIISGGSISEIMWSGGEPLFHNAHYEILESAQENASKMTLSYSSNLNKLSFGKNRSVLELWQPFKRVDLRVSFDADDKIYSYVRTGGNIANVEQNIKRVQSMPNVRVLGSVTASVFNMSRLLDIMKYVTSLDISFHASIVQYPPSLNPKLLPPDIKSKITSEVTDFMNDTVTNVRALLPNASAARVSYFAERLNFYGDYLLNYMNSEDKFSDWHLFKQHANALDNLNSTNYLDVYPEFKPYE